MQHEFWHNKWQKNEIGFHLSAVNPLLIKHFSTLKLESNSRIFLPLCGKTLDIHWLLAQAYRVTGVELSSIAVAALFDELKLKPSISNIGKLKRYSATNIDIFNGDIFALSAELLGKVDIVYDRAALVALPPEMRSHYTYHLMHLTNKAPQLLICFMYDQTQLFGPPFSISEKELNQHYHQVFTLNLLESVEVTGGLKNIVPAQEQIWSLTQKKITLSKKIRSI